MKVVNVTTHRVGAFLVCCGLILGLAFTTPGQNAETKKALAVTLIPPEPESERQTITNPGPAGAWSVAFVPDRAPLYYKAPVVLVGTTTLTSKTSRNLQLTDVKIANFSDKPLAAVSIRWVLFSTKDPRKPLAFDHPGFFAAEIQPQEAKSVACPILNFGKFIADKAKELPIELWDKDALNGDFQLKFSIHDAVFADGSVWYDSDTRLDVSWIFPDLPAPAVSCPNKQCSYNTPDSSAKCAGGESGTTQGLRCVLTQPCINQYCTCNTTLCGYNDN